MFNNNGKECSECFKRIADSGYSGRFSTLKKKAMVQFVAKLFGFFQLETHMALSLGNSQHRKGVIARLSHPRPMHRNTPSLSMLGMCTFTHVCKRGGNALAHCHASTIACVEHAFPCSPQARDLPRMPIDLPVGLRLAHPSGSAQEHTQQRSYAPALPHAPVGAPLQGPRESRMHVRKCALHPGVQ